MWSGMCHPAMIERLINMRHKSLCYDDSDVQFNEGDGFYLVEYNRSGYFDTMAVIADEFVAARNIS